MKSKKQFVKYFVCFLLGILFVFVATSVYRTIDKFLITGSKIQSQSSYPLGHIATLYSRGGLGDQTLTLKVDGKTVWVSGDQPPGDLDEKLIWDETGQIVTLEFNGKKILIYDALNREIR